MTYHIPDAATLAEPLPVQVPPSKHSHGWRLRLSGLLRSNEPSQQLCEVDVHPRPPSPPPSAPTPTLLSPVSTYPALRPRRASTDSFPTPSDRDRDSDEDDAARRIQLWIRELRQRGTNVGLRGSMAQTIASDDDLENEDDEMDREFNVYVWEGAALGLEFIEDEHHHLPCVTMADGNAAFPGMWHVCRGDLLIAINETSTATMSFDDAMHILDHGLRPAMLRFRHPPSSSFHRPDMLQYRRRCEVLDRDLAYVFWREDDGPLGLTLKPPLGHGYPRVRTVHPDGAVARGGASIDLGDELIRINQQDVGALSGRTSLQVLRAAPRPLVLTFARRRRRPTTTTVTSTSTTTTVAGAETL